MIAKNINNIAQSIESLVSETFEGVLPPELLAKGKRGINFALDFLQPHVQSMGLRVAQLSRQNIEIVIPDRERNLDQTGFLHKSVMTSAAIEAGQLLWLYNRPQENFAYQLKSMTVDFFAPAKGPLRLKFELSDIERETCYAELAQHNKAEVQFHLQIFDENSILVAKFGLQAALTQAPSIEWT